MLKFTGVLFALLAIIQIGLAKNECKDPSTGKQYNAGDEYSVPGTCIKSTCHADGSVSGLTCAAFTLGDQKCTIIEQDNSKPYPECCSRPVCKGD